MEKLTDIVKTAPKPKLNVDVGKGASDAANTVKNTVQNTGKKLAETAGNSVSKAKEFL